MPILMLGYGANPNDRGFMSSSILGLELQELPIELIKKLIEKSVKHRSEFLMAVSFGRIHVVNCMLVGFVGNDTSQHWQLRKRRAMRRW